MKKRSTKEQRKQSETEAIRLRLLDIYAGVCGAFSGFHDAVELGCVNEPQNVGKYFGAVWTAFNIPPASYMRGVIGFEKQIDFKEFAAVLYDWQQRFPNEEQET